MALTVDEANAVSHEFFDETITSQVYDASPFFAKLKADKRTRTDGGDSIHFPIRYAELGQSRNPGFREKVDFQSNETRTAGILQWAPYDAHTMIHWDERVYNTGRGRIINLLADKSEELKADFQEKLDEALFASSSASTALQSLQVIVDSSDAYAGIDPSDASEWAATEDSSQTIMKLDGQNSLRQRYNDARFNKFMPNFFVTTRDLFGKAESLMEPQRRYEDEQMGSMGFTSIKLFGHPLVDDPKVPANHFYGLDMKSFILRVHSEHNMKVLDWFELKQAGFPNAMAKYMDSVLQLQCNRRKTNFKFTALDPDL